MTWDPGDLLESARRAREHAHAPYSRHRVGAALLADDGRVFTGCNVESSSYGLTVCAERVALFKALSEGARSFRAIAVAADPAAACRLCGACRQVLWDFAPGLVVITAEEGAVRERPLADLLPDAFDRRFLERG